MEALRGIINTHKTKGLTLTDQLIISGSSFLVTILLTRLLGLDQVGIFSLLWVLVLFSQSMHQAAVISPMLVFVGKETNETDRDHYLGSLAIIQFAFALVIALGVAVFMHMYMSWYPETDITGIRYRLPLLIIFILNNDFLRKSLYARFKFGYSVVVDAVAYGVQILALLVMGLYGELTLERVILIMLLVQMLVSVSSLFLIPLKKIDINYFKVLVKRHFTFSSWLIMAAVFQWFVGNVLLLVGARYLSMEIIGALRIIQNLMGVLNVILLSFESYIPVSASRIFVHSGKHGLLTYLRSTMLKATLLFTVPMALFMLLPEFIISLTYGDQYINYAYLLKAYTLLYVFIIIGMILRIGLRAIERTRPIFISYVLTALVSAVLAKPLILAWGDLGVIIGLALSQVIMIIYYGILLFSTNKQQ